MIVQTITKTEAKPFLKWAGGKSQLLSAIDLYLPRAFRREPNVTYIEPFVGGGAMLFYMLQNYHNIRHAVINDINVRLINTYKVIRDEPYRLIDALKAMQSTFKALCSYEGQKEYYLNVRERFNHSELSNVEQAAYMIFLNRTCFNGLYRENSKGDFNVPFGRYANPAICREEVIVADSELLQGVEILSGDFSQTAGYIQGYTFFYLDPPYRPLGGTSSFNSYVKEAFDDSEQIRLKEFYTDISGAGIKAMMSNSDCKGCNDEDDFLDMLYKDFYIERVYANRCINANPTKRGTLTELLIRNYEEYQGKVTII